MYIELVYFLLMFISFHAYLCICYAYLCKFYTPTPQAPLWVAPGPPALAVRAPTRIALAFHSVEFETQTNHVEGYKRQ
jgi:hypothetical protein